MSQKRSRSLKMPSEERPAAGASSGSQPFLEPTVDTEASSRGSVHNAWDEDMTGNEATPADKPTLLCDDMGIPSECHELGVGNPTFNGSWHHSFVELRFDMEDKLHLVDNSRQALHLCDKNQSKYDALQSHCGRYWWGGDEKRSVWSYGANSYLETVVPVFVRDQCPVPAQKNEAPENWDKDGTARMLVWHGGRWHICIPGFGCRETEWVLAACYSSEVFPPVKAFDAPQRFERWRGDDPRGPQVEFFQPRLKNSTAPSLVENASKNQPKKSTKKINQRVRKKTITK